MLPVTSAFEWEALRVGFEISQDAQSTVQLRSPWRTRGARRARTCRRLRPGRSAGTGRSVLRWRHRGGMAPPARSERDHPRAVARAPRGCPVAVADRSTARISTAASAPRRAGRAVLAGLRSRRLPADSDVCRAEHQPALPAGSDGRIPLVLTCAKSLFFCESQHRQIAKLRASAPEPQVEVHPEAAAARGIAAGDWVGCPRRAAASARGRS